MRVLVAIVGAGGVSADVWRDACASATDPVPVVADPCGAHPIIGWATGFEVIGDEVWCDVDAAIGPAAHPCPTVEINGIDRMTGDPFGAVLRNIFPSDPLPEVAERIKGKS